MAPAITFQHEDTFGFDAGGTTKGKTNSVEDDTGVFRLTSECHPQLNLNFIQIPKYLDGVTLYADDIFRYLVPEARGVNFLTCGAEFHFNKNFGFTFSYKIGRDAPAFKKVDTFNFGFSGQL